MKDKIRGLRANNVIVDDFIPMSASCSGVIIGGFAEINTSPMYEVKYVNCKGCGANIDNIKPCEYCGIINQ
jgi:hypothetical protein